MKVIPTRFSGGGARTDRGSSEDEDDRAAPRVGRYVDFSENFDPGRVRSRKEQSGQQLRRAGFFVRSRILTARGLITVAVPVAVLVFTIGTITNSSRNWALERQADVKKREIELLQLENDRLKLENQYYASEEYQELAARKLQNKKLDGETAVDLPDNSQEVKNKHKAPTQAELVAASEKSNFDQWLEFLLGGRR